jgi:hypothetical protein
MEVVMSTSKRLNGAAALALAALCTGCVTWNEMDRSERGTAVGATGGALVGAAVGGPIGAVVGAGAGGYIGHHQGFGASGTATATVDRDRDAREASVVRSAQRSLNDRGFDAGPADGRWGPNTEHAVRQFQQSSGLPQTGQLDRPTLSALGVVS